MFDKIKSAASGAYTRARVWNRERKERAEERRERNAAQRARAGAPLLWVWFLIVVAVACLIGSTWMLVLFIAGAVGHVDGALDWRTGNDGEPGRWVWFAEANVHYLIAFGLLCFCIGIGAFNAVWLHIRHYLSGLFLRVLTVLGIATAIFMVSGAIVMQQVGTEARERDEIAAVGAAQTNVSAVQAEIAQINADWERLCADHLTTYQAQACRSGAAAWQRRIEIARQQNDANTRYQIPFYERAIVDAEQGDAWRARLLELNNQLRLASTDVVEAEVQRVELTGWMPAFKSFLEDIRKPFVAVLGELLAMTMFGVALAAWRSRYPVTDVQSSGWADEAHRIEDLRDEPEMPVHAMVPPKKKQRVYNPETGREEVWVQPKGHWRPTGKRKKNEDGTEGEIMEHVPEVEPDETGVETDGGARQASPRTQNDDSPEHNDHVHAQDAADKAVDEVAGHDGEEAPDDWEAWGEESAAAADNAEDESANDDARDDHGEGQPFAGDEQIHTAGSGADQNDSDDRDEGDVTEHSEPPVDATDAEEQDDPSGGDDENSGHCELPDNQGTMSPTDEPEQDAPRPRGLLPAE